VPRQPAAAADVQRSHRRRPALNRLGIGKFNAAMAEIGTVLAFMFYLCTYIDSRLVESELYPAPCAGLVAQTAPTQAGGRPLWRGRLPWLEGLASAGGQDEGPFHFDRQDSFRATRIHFSISVKNINAQAAAGLASASSAAAASAVEKLSAAREASEALAEEAAPAPAPAAAPAPTFKLPSTIAGELRSYSYIIVVICAVAIAAVSVGAGTATLLLEFTPEEAPKRLWPFWPKS
jgi:hypothetical protein